MNAILTTSAIEIRCPKCEEGITSPTGSYVWARGEYQRVLGTMVECQDCGAKVRVPDARLVRIG